MPSIVFLGCFVAVIFGLAVGAAVWHRRHRGEAARAARRWWQARGWSWSRPAYLTLHLALGLAVTVGMLALFAQITDWVTGHAAITVFDQRFDERLHSLASPLGLRVATALSLIGGPSAMAALCVIGAAIIYFRRHDRELLLGWVLAIAGGGLLDLVLKTVFHRPRPLFADPFAHGYGWSFPSGHSMGSVIGFGMLAYVIEQGLHRETAKLAVIVLAALLCAAIGVSRLYLGVHFPSDVLGGFAAGLMWLSVCLSGLEIARARHPRGEPGVPA